MRDVTAIIVPWVITTLALFALLDWDEARLSPRALEDAWPPATRLLAIAYLGILTLPIHLYRTRARRYAEPAIERSVATVFGVKAGDFLGRFPSLLSEVLLWLLLTGPLALVLTLVVDWAIEESIDCLPDSCLGGLLWGSLLVFAAAMVVRRSRRRRARSA
jgi:hypothetical protein